MPDDPRLFSEPGPALARRELLARRGMGFGLIGLTGVLADDVGIAAARAASPSIAPTGWPRRLLQWRLETHPPRSSLPMV